MMTSKGQVTVNRSSMQDSYPSRIYQETKLLERQDPVVYNPTINQTEISKEKITFYEENRYLFLESFFTEDQVQFWKQELARLWEQSKEVQKPEVIREPGNDEIRSIFAVHRDDEVFKQMASDQRLQDIVNQILGSQT